jgi:hypothetical protein
MSAADQGVVRDTLNLEQPDGNFSDEPPTELDPDLQKRLEQLNAEREANRQGPSHPAHDLHQAWLDERGLGPEWDSQ